MNKATDLHHGYSRTHNVALAVLDHIGLPSAQVRDNGEVVFVTGPDDASQAFWRELVKWHGVKMLNGTEIRVCGCPSEFVS